ncbi:GH3 auxin-responsive promoter family protein [Balneolales bacterium ANBcel1]|nr:GH3 auxin-responsive promoter family protein [Balneolales bacterium ANBcel1]
MSRSVEAAQKKVLSHMLRKGARTEYGKRFGFSSMKGFEEYSQQVPLSTYDDVEPYIERLKNGEQNLLWPARIQNFAVSAGTTGKGKHIPLSEDRLRSDQRFMRKVIISYFRQKPNFLHFFLGSHVSLPGNIERLEPRSNIRIGEISAYLAKLSPGWLSMFQVRSPRTMIQEEWTEKFDRTLEKAVKADIRKIVAIPSWALRFFQRALEITGKQYIREIWPNLRLLICGGEALNTYRPHFNKLLDGLNMDYIENYGASESYFAFSDDLKRTDLRLIVDNGVFYEWIPNPKEHKDDLARQKTVPTWEVEKGVPYSLVVSSNSGLWRYMINDVIEFTDLDQPRIQVVGRVSEIFDRFGEAVESHEAQKALEKTAEQAGAEFSVFTMGGLIDDDIGAPRHFWFVQWVRKPDDIASFTKQLDENLGELNRHYKNRRTSMGIHPPVIFNLSKDALHEWRETHQALHAQTKMPRILDDEEQILHMASLCRRYQEAESL